MTVSVAELVPVKSGGDVTVQLYSPSNVLSTWNKFSFEPAGSVRSTAVRLEGYDHVTVPLNKTHKTSKVRLKIFYLLYYTNAFQYSVFSIVNSETCRSKQDSRGRWRSSRSRHSKVYEIL